MDEAAWTPAFTRPLPLRDGIYRGLAPNRLEEIEPFLAQYRRVRALDGYRRRDTAYYASLPHVDRRDPQAAIWRVRQESFRHLQGVLRRFHDRRLRVLDLGAGSGWLSYRLTALEHTCVAVDWLDDPEDGLGAARHYPLRFTCLQADFDDLAIAAGQFDLVVFNASLHYANDPASTLRHAHEALAPEGIIVVMDSPVFATDEAGRRMVGAQQAVFRSACEHPLRWGAGFVNETVLAESARSAGLRANWIPSRGPIGWAMRRRLSAVLHRKPAARFGVWFAAA